MENEVHVWHDSSGRIVAWGHTTEGTKARLKAIPIAKPGHAVLTVRVQQQDVPTLHETHRVDAAAKKLVRSEVSR